MLSRELKHVDAMDIGDPNREPDDRDEEGLEEKAPQRRQLPRDLPKSLDDRRPVHSYAGETEMYDAWQGTQRAFTPNTHVEKPAQLTA